MRQLFVDNATGRRDLRIPMPRLKPVLNECFNVQLEPSPSYFYLKTLFLCVIRAKYDPKIKNCIKNGFIGKYVGQKSGFGVFLLGVFDTDN